MPSSLRLERITSPGLAAWGRISQSGLCASTTGVHHCAGYWPAAARNNHEAVPMSILFQYRRGTSGLDPLRLQIIRVVVVDAVLAILPLLLFDAHRPFLALLATVAHDLPPVCSFPLPLPHGRGSVKPKNLPNRDCKGVATKSPGQHTILSWQAGAALPSSGENRFHDFRKFRVCGRVRAEVESVGQKQ